LGGSVAGSVAVDREECKVPVFIVDFYTFREEEWLGM
jgi:hypothetical protein